MWPFCATIAPQGLRCFACANHCVAASSGGFVPPILSTDHLAANGAAGLSSVSAVSCTANRGLPGITRPRPLRCDEIAPAWSATLSPCSRLHARLAGYIAATAGGLLPHPFTPYRPWPAGILSVAVVVSRPLPDACPHLRFRGATLSPPKGGRGVGKFLYGSTPAATDSFRQIFCC